MSSTLNSTDLLGMLRHVVQRIEQEEAYLNSLDAAIGDGDHGITMRLGFQAIGKRLTVLTPTVPMSDILLDAGCAFMEATGGAIGVILGRMLIAGGKSLQGSDSMGPTQLRALLSTMEAAATKAGKAVPGDKTILDALHPAVDAASSTSVQDDLVAMLSKAAEAADLGAKNTANMHCRIGRASRLGDRVIGHPDPGATSFSIILKAMAEWARKLEYVS